MSSTDDEDEFMALADTVAAEAEALAERLTGPFAGLDDMQERARRLAEQYLREAASTLSEFADMDWTETQDADW